MLSCRGNYFFLDLAQRAFCAAMILARPSADIARFLAGVAGFVVVDVDAPKSKDFACLSRAISSSSTAMTSFICM
jgi:hypothetical protein